MCSAVEAAASARVQSRIDSLAVLDSLAAYDSLAARDSMAARDGLAAPDSLATLDLGSNKILDIRGTAGTGGYQSRVQGSGCEPRPGISLQEAREQWWQHSRRVARENDHEEVADICHDSRTHEAVCEALPQTHDDERHRQMQLQLRWQQLQQQQHDEPHASRCQSPAAAAARERRQFASFEAQHSVSQQLQQRDEPNASRCHSPAAAREREPFDSAEPQRSVGQPEETDCADSSLCNYGGSPGSRSADSYGSYITLAPPSSPSPPPQLHRHPFHQAAASAAEALAANAETGGNGRLVLAAVRRFEAPMFGVPDSQCSTPLIEPPPSQPPLAFAASRMDGYARGRERSTDASPEADMAAAAKLFWQQYHDDDASVTDSDHSDSDSDSLQSDCNDRG